MKNTDRIKIEVDLQTLKHNLQKMQIQISKDTTIIGVVKADAYGHGLITVADALRGAGIKMFGVAIIDEAVELRKNGFLERILILGACFKNTIASFIDYDCEQTVYSYEIAKEIQLAAQKFGKIAKIHIKIDTGMGRLGFSDNEKSVAEVFNILQMKNIKVEGICTHFASSSSLDKTYARMQHERFTRFIDELRKMGAKVPLMHMANSGAVLELPEYNYDYVRLGIVLYGIYPSSEASKDKTRLKPVMSIKSCVSFLKTINTGDCISYNSLYKAEKETRVATIPIGYADGIRKDMECGKGRVLINGQFAPIIGCVCMDQFMVDVSNCGDVKIEDEVVIIGAQGNNSISVEEVASVCNTIPYEVICNFSKRVPRVYKG